jgi:hypothetical protein
MKLLLEKKYIQSWDKIVIIGDKTRDKQKDPLIRVTTVH